jgi:signal transduction histidine kinase
VVLVVDDEPEHRRLLGMILGRECTVMPAASGSEAMGLARAVQLDLAIVDYRMPEMNGAEVLAELRRIQPDCVRFLVTAYSEVPVLRDAINLGEVYRCITKPWDPEILRVDIRRALEHRQARLDLSRAEKMSLLGQLVGSVAHDLRNFLVPLSAAPRVLRNSSDPEIQELGQQLGRSAEATADLVEELHALVRGDRPQYRLARHDFAEVLGSALDVLSHDPALAERALSVDVEPGLPPLPLAASRVMRLVQNLVRNAVHATKPGGMIQVRLTRDAGSKLALEVSDDGIGMEASALERMFDPLFTTKGSQGLGLGLAVCKAVVDGHGGTLECRSAPGEGTSFMARFPC